MQYIQRGRQYHFDVFEVTKANCNAFEKAKQFADNADSKPLAIFGGTATGKTHLLYAVKNAIEQNSPELKVILTTTADMVKDIKDGSAEQFREKYLPVIFVNPCLMPFHHLPRLGFQGNIKQFIPLFGMLDKLESDNVSCIVGADDEIIDTYDFTERMLGNARFRRIPGGKHSGATLPLKSYFGEIMYYYTEILPR